MGDGDGGAGAHQGVQGLLDLPLAGGVEGRGRLVQDEDARVVQREPLPERELRADLIAAENAELARLYEDGTISAATRRRLQQSLDLEVTRLAERQHREKIFVA